MCWCLCVRVALPLIYHPVENVKRRRPVRSQENGNAPFQRHSPSVVFVAYVFIFMIIVFFSFYYNIFPPLCAALSPLVLLLPCVWRRVPLPGCSASGSARITPKQTCDVIRCDGNHIKCRFNDNGCAAEAAVCSPVSKRSSGPQHPEKR